MGNEKDSSEKKIVEGKKRDGKFGGNRKSSYICSVKTMVMTTPLNAGSKPVSKLLH